MGLGIDGFQFFCPLTEPEALADYNNTIKAFFRAVERLDADFKLTVCLCLSEQKMTEAEKIRRWGDALKDLLAEPVWSDIWLGSVHINWPT